jgi:AcrR family transcriptional regulator
MSLQFSFQQTLPDSTADMRTRKKARTRIAIQDAALDLFAAQGYDATSIEQIVLRADASASTFFRYFGTKADIILNDHDTHLPQLCAAIMEQPPEVSDMEAVRLALKSAWVPIIDPVRTLRTARAVAQSAFLCGVAYNVGRGWVDVVGEALAKRRADPAALGECLLAARTALNLFGNATELWVASDAKADLGALIDDDFRMLERLLQR